jgi:hypothetical protein
MPYFLVFVRYQDALDPAEKLALLVGHHASMQFIYLITYVVFGIALAFQALALRARSMHATPVLAQAVTVVGLIWAFAIGAAGVAAADQRFAQSAVS